MKVPLFDQKEKVQIIVKQLGSDEKRFGSVTFPVSKLSKSAGNTFIHWATLFENLQHDEFESPLGTDEPDFPRIMLEYHITGGKYTSLY